MTEENNSVSLYLITDVNAKKKRIYLENFYFDRKRVYMASSEEVEYYQKFFQEALDHNIFLSVPYDDKRGVILQQ